MDRDVDAESHMSKEEEEDLLFWKASDVDSLHENRDDEQPTLTITKSEWEALQAQNVRILSALAKTLGEESMKRKRGDPRG